jgi:toxin ParE1/3/4
VYALIFHHEASAELRSTVEFYESRLNGLGSRFLSAVGSALERISSLPGSGSPLDEGLRKLVVAGFPYNIIYQELEDHRLLLAVAHHYRRPGYWEQHS